MSDVILGAVIGIVATLLPVLIKGRQDRKLARRADELELRNKLCTHVVDLLSTGWNELRDRRGWLSAIEDGKFSGMVEVKHLHDFEKAITAVIILGGSESPLRDPLMSIRSLLNAQVDAIEAAARNPTPISMEVARTFIEKLGDLLQQVEDVAVDNMNIDVTVDAKRSQQHLQSRRSSRHSQQ